MYRKHSIFFTLAFVLAAGCTQGSLLDSDFSHKEAVIGTDKETMEVEGASFHKDELVTDTIKVISSRSWSVGNVEDYSWLAISRTNGINLGKIMREWPVVLSFDDNPGQIERDAQVAFTIDGEKFLLPVTQKPLSPVLALESPDTYAVPELGDTIRVAVRSNCRWTAKADEASDAEVVLDDSTTRIKSDTLLLTVKANKDYLSEKKACIRLSADGAEDVTINIIQDKLVPRLKIDAELSETDVLAAEGDYKVVFETNSNWSASLAEGASEGVSLSVAEGSPGDELFVHFPDTRLEGAAATVVITTGSGLKDSITFTQKGGLFITFRKWPDNNGWGSVYQPVKNLSSGKNLPRYAEDSNAYIQDNDSFIGKDPYGYQYIFHHGREESMIRSDHSGLVIGSITRSPAFHIEFPAIEGKSLREVKLMLGNSDVKLKNQEITATGTTGFITDTDGKVVNGGETQQVSTYQTDDDWISTQTIPSFVSDYSNHTESMFDFVLADSQPGTTYRYYGEYRQVIRWFILYYE